jgi:hypothetical protein
MAGLDSLITGLNPIGMGLNVAGGIMNVIGAFGAKDEAKRQLEAQKSYGINQRATFSSGYGDLMTQAKGAATYQGDLSRYTKMEQQAELAKRMASGQSRGAGEQIARDQAAQASANALAAASRGAGSGTDIMTAALLSQQGENAAQNAISSRSAEQQYNAQQLAQQQQFAALGQTAAASARERGLEFSSLAAKQANIQGVTQGKLEGEMNLNQNLFEGEQAKAAALQQADSAIWSGIGNIASGIGGSMMNMQAQDTQMSNLTKLYNPGSSASQGTMNKLGSFFTSGQFSPTGQSMYGSSGISSPSPSNTLNSMAIPSRGVPAYGSSANNNGGFNLLRF